LNITWKRDKGTAEAAGVTFVITNDIRNELNGRRRLHDPKEVVRAVVNGQWGPSYMPRPFPRGAWEILDIEKSVDPNYAPIKIKTDAHQPVEVWALDDRGGYDHPTGETVEDGGYWLHWCGISKTTLGCGRVGTDTDKQVKLLAGMIRKARTAGDTVTLEVV
jgi:hypothetical protein